MEEINDALIVLIILKVFTQSAFKGFLSKKRWKTCWIIKNIYIHINMFISKAYLYRYAPIPHLPSLQNGSSLEKVI